LEAILEILENSVEKIEEGRWRRGPGGAAKRGPPPRPRSRSAAGPAKNNRVEWYPVKQSKKINK
jgi:hypothetical protein